MIFVVCGTRKYPLNRLLKEVDDLVFKGIIREEVVVQAGSSDYPLKHCTGLKIVDSEEFEKKIEECSILITHGGIGAILAGKKKQKPVIVYPRSAKYGENIDDHQWQIGRAFAKRNMVLLCERPEDLEEQIRKCCDFPFEDIDMASQGKYMTELIKKTIEAWRK